MMEALTEPLLADKDECESSLGDLSEGFFSAVENDQEQGESPTIARRPQDENDYAVTPSWSLLLYRIFHTPLLPEYGGDHNLKTQIRFIKFLLVTILGIATTHWTFLLMNWEHRTGLKLSDIILYEGNFIALDCLVFFGVGRLYHQRLAVDHLAWITVAALSCVYTSLLPQFTFLQHSLTLYEMHCTWPWQLWCFVLGGVLPAVAVPVVWHIRHAVRSSDLTRKALELTVTVVLLLAPQIANPSFHFHHWYAGFLLGMHSNYDAWVSRATMSWCWGQYMNGIAVWGRDPTLTCAYAYYISTRQHCTTTDASCWADRGLEDYEPPDWRHCRQGLS